VSETNSVIEVAGLRKAYGTRAVLTGIDFEVRRGEVFAVLGPNGAGKTTTVEILEGYREPTGGTVRVLGQDPWLHPMELREQTGVVLQECGFPSHVRVEELVNAWRGYYRSPRDTDDLLGMVELTHERSTLVRRLSGGQRRRLDFALALSGDPELIFLDEPTTGFDPEARHRCWSAIDNLRQLGKTILLTTHYLDEAERLADRIAILAGGRIRAAGTAAELARLAGAPTVVSFRCPPAVDIDRNLSNDIQWSREADRVTIRTQRPSAIMQQLLLTFGDVDDLAVTPPTLQDSYLALVAETRVRTE
jgi:ABC-2 type transport system ATP-binding protein